VVLDGGIEQIWPMMFGGCTSLSKMVLPSTTKKIGFNAFNYCKNLKNVVLNEGLQFSTVTCIRSCVFEDCQSLLSINIPSTVTDIGNNVFQFCESLREVILHEKIRKIEEDAFCRCRSLDIFNFPTMSSRLGTIACHWINNRSKVNGIRGVVERRNDELLVPAAVMANGRNWENIRGIFCKIELLISYYEMKEATITLELALWKSKVDQAGSNVTNRVLSTMLKCPDP
jgi:hypothetical protein